MLSFSYCSGKTSFPEIEFYGKFNIDSREISYVSFNILDSYQYHENNDDNFLKKTKFVEHNIQILSVIKAMGGNTLREKLLYILERVPLKISVEDFAKKLITYAMLRYILSRLLYGEFNIKYLKGCKYNRFIKDLRKSRFSDFINILEEQVTTTDNQHHNLDYFFKYR